MTLFIDVTSGFLRALSQLMPVYAFGDVRAIYMRVCCARMSSDVLNDVEDELFSIILRLNHVASGRTSCCVLGRIVISVEQLMSAGFPT